MIQDKATIENVIQVSYDIKQSKKREIEGLVETMEKFNVQKGLIITQDYEAKETIDEKKIVYMPLWKWLLS